MTSLMASLFTSLMTLPAACRAHAHLLLIDHLFPVGDLIPDDPADVLDHHAALQDISTQCEIRDA